MRAASERVLQKRARQSQTSIRQESPSALTTASLLSARLRARSACGEGPLAVAGPDRRSAAAKCSRESETRFAPWYSRARAKWLPFAALSSRARREVPVKLRSRRPAARRRGPGRQVFPTREPAPPDRRPRAGRAARGIRGADAEAASRSVPPARAAKRAPRSRRRFRRRRALRAARA